MIPTDNLSVTLTRDKTLKTLGTVYRANPMSITFRTGGVGSLEDVTQLRAELHTQRATMGQEPAAVSFLESPSGQMAELAFSAEQMNLDLGGADATSRVFYLLLRAVKVDGTADIYQLGRIVLVAHPASDITPAPPSPSITFATTAQLVTVEGMGTPPQIQALANNRQAGVEYLLCVHNLIRGQSPIPACISGDSTSLQDYLPDADRWQNSLPRFAQRRGIYGVTAVNTATSGICTETWRTTNVPLDIATSARVIIAGPGLNDPYYHRTAEQAITSLRAGLAAYRAWRNVSNLSIVLCMPNAAHDPSTGRDAAYFESILSGWKQAARDYQCFFVDKYSTAIDAAHGVNLWLDPPGVHPLAPLNSALALPIAEALFPANLAASYGQPFVPVEPRVGYTLPGSEAMGVFSSGRLVYGAGFINVAAPGPIAAGADICLVPAGFRPRAGTSKWGVSLCAWNGSAWEFPKAFISEYGQVVTQQNITINATRIYFGDGVWHID